MQRFQTGSQLPVNLRVIWHNNGDSAYLQRGNAPFDRSYSCNHSGKTSVLVQPVISASHDSMLGYAICVRVVIIPSRVQLRAWRPERAREQSHELLPQRHSPLPGGRGCRQRWTSDASVTTCSASEGPAHLRALPAAIKQCNHRCWSASRLSYRLLPRPVIEVWTACITPSSNAEHCCLACCSVRRAMRHDKLSRCGVWVHTSRIHDSFHGHTSWSSQIRPLVSVVWCVRLFVSAWCFRECSNGEPTQRWQQPAHQQPGPVPGAQVLLPQVPQGELHGPASLALGPGGAAGAPHRIRLQASAGLRHLQVNIRAAAGQCEWPDPHGWCRPRPAHVSSDALSLGLRALMCPLLVVGMHGLLF